MKDVVVLAGSTPWSVLSLCKCACKHSAKTYVVCVKNGWGRKYAKSRYVYKAYDTQEKELDFLWIDFFDTNTFSEKPILYVTNDYVCQIVERNRKFYEDHFILCMASSYIINFFIDKNKASIEAVKYGLTVPKTQEIYTEGDIEVVTNGFVFPVIIKPVTFLDHSNAKFKTQICINEVQFREFISKYLHTEINIQCQEYIKGEDKDCVFYQFYRDVDGNITDCMGEKTMQSNGIMTIGTTRYDDDLSKICRAFLKKIDYVGIGGLEFKRYNGKYYFIEMSTRTEGFLPISDMADVSLAEASFLSLNGQSYNKTVQKDGVQYVVFRAMLLDALQKEGLPHAMGRFFKVLFSPKTKFVGAFLDLCFALKLDVKVL